MIVVRGSFSAHCRCTFCVTRVLFHYQRSPIQAKVDLLIGIDVKDLTYFIVLEGKVEQPVNFRITDLVIPFFPVSGDFRACDNVSCIQEIAKLPCTLRQLKRCDPSLGHDIRGQVLLKSIVDDFEHAYNGR